MAASGFVECRKSKCRDEFLAVTRIQAIPTSSASFDRPWQRRDDDDSEVVVGVGLVLLLVLLLACIYRVRVPLR